MTTLEKLSRAATRIPAIALGEAFWYFIFAAIAWLVLYVLLGRWARRRRIAAKDPTWRQMSWEVFYSLRSMLVFGSVGGFIVYAVTSGWTQMYFKVEQYGQTYFWLSIGLMILLHDTYFYWTHRLMHHPRLFRWMHHTHHLATNPSPWAAYSFSVPEALVQAGIGPLIIFTIPNHPGAFAIFMIWQIGFNVLGHCGHELYPRWFLRSWCGRVFNTTTHHAMHHESNRVNYGLYFNVWDRLLDTNHHRYAERFGQVTGDIPREPLAGA